MFVLQALTTEHMEKLLRHALKDPRGFGNQTIHMEERILHGIAVFANGDGRMALNTLDMAVLNGEIGPDGSITVKEEVLEQCTGKKMLLYDRNGEEHYNLISALHKSMRNSDPDAAMYWLSRMLEAGEDPLYVARRLIRFASEDVGLAACSCGLPGVSFHRHAGVQRESGTGCCLSFPGTEVECAVCRVWKSERRCTEDAV